MVMANFILLAALLCVCVLAVLLRPLWTRVRGVALGVAVLALLSTGLLYKLVGTPQALDPASRQAPKTLDDAIVQLNAALARDPQQVEGWLLLGQAYQRTGNTNGARDAFAKAAALAPDDADILTQAAQARAMANAKHEFDAKALAQLQRALQVTPSTSARGGSWAWRSAKPATMPMLPSRGHRCWRKWMPAPPPACAQKSTSPATKQACHHCPTHRPPPPQPPC